MPRSSTKLWLIEQTPPIDIATGAGVLIKIYENIFLKSIQYT